MPRRRFTVVAALAVAGLLASGVGAASAAPGGRHHGLAVETLSGPARYVSGDAARIRVTVPRSLPLDRARVTVNGRDVTAAFTPDDQAPHALEGVVRGLPAGQSTVEARAERERTSLRLVNHPVTGPMFSGPQQPDFFCSTPQHLAGFDLTGPFLDEDCSLPTVTSHYYRTTGGAWRPYDPAAPRPEDLATTTTADGHEVDFVIRWERGTINRFVYTIAVLDPEASGPADLPHWNRKLIYHFGGGVAIGHYQGSNNQGESRYVHGLGQGYAIAWSTGTKTNTHYNMVLGGETAMMVKSRFVTEYGDPVYTVGLGGSGGGIQQYLYGQNHRGLLDGAIPQYSYPDMVTQTIHVGDCELLERWMDRKVIADPTSKWRTWTNRTLLEGLASSDTVANPYQQLTPWMPSPGSSECVNAWRGLSPLTLNPKYGTVPGITPEQQAKVEWTHWNDAVNVYGRDPLTGYARSTWDNVGVQYGLQALRDGQLTPEEFLDLNATVGGWKPPQDAVQEGCPFIETACPGDVDVWSVRNQTVPGANGVAPRTEGSVEAMRAVYRSGMVFDGDIDIPVIDWRHYLDAELDMHNARQSFASRQRMLDRDGSAANQVVWFTDARPARAFDQTPQALAVMDQWLTNLAADPAGGVVAAKPAEAVDSCFATDGTPLYRGADAWRGIIDSRADGPCTARFPINGTSRTVAGGPFDEQHYKCALQPVRAALGKGVYGDWRPSRAELARLGEIFPSGVCDYRRPDVGRPR
ncbi:hypothetical protein BLA60_02155 [Actinophytocola xinjiangensis]|uniref:DUF6351 domain-containing protein n=1 Tax=Actinophytocola xinjiangensis TaxID=485602 RepID=A0A7Z1B0Q1_9PSEU|nr:DUF6351 family protein [Actinophytocola xinjiangensis]OLF14003.1 hypothetical protein BLA60_02155 [Actinophytocola xinjiangensis]